MHGCTPGLHQSGGVGVLSRLLRLNELDEPEEGQGDYEWVKCTSRICVNPLTTNLALNLVIYLFIFCLVVETPFRAYRFPTVGYPVYHVKGFYLHMAVEIWLHSLLPTLPVN